MSFVQDYSRPLCRIPCAISTVFSLSLSSLNFNMHQYSYACFIMILLYSVLISLYLFLFYQTPGPPASPWIWCRTLSPYQFTIEWNEPATYGDVNIRAYQASSCVRLCANFHKSHKNWIGFLKNFVFCETFSIHRKVTFSLPE